MRAKAAILASVLGLIIFMQSAVLAEINIPAQYGTIKEAYSQEGAAQAAGKTIICIQDAHCNYEAQKNSAMILEYLAREYKLKLIMVEGGSGDVNLSFLRGYADKKSRKEVAEKYLKDGKISGEEYLDIISDYPLELYGVEDETLYNAHLTSFEQTDSLKIEALKYLEGLSRTIESLKPFIYSEELKRLEQMQKRYEDKSVSLNEYCQFLKEAAVSKGLNPEIYPQVSTFAEVSRLEKEIDFPTAEAQRNSFIKALAGQIDQAELKELIARSEEFKAKKIAPSDYYSYLEYKAKDRIDIARDYPQLKAYIDYINLSKGIKAEGLVKEIAGLEDKIKETYFTDEKQKELDNISRYVRILTRILNLELTPEEYAYFQANKENFLTASWTEFLSRNCREYNLSGQPVASTLIDDNLKELEAFYELGAEREKAFVRNAERKLDGSGEKIAVLITGGFHTPGVTAGLKEKGYSYMVVAPVITEKGDSNVYFSVLRGKKNQPEEALSEE